MNHQNVTKEVSATDFNIAQDIEDDVSNDFSKKKEQSEARNNKVQLKLSSGIIKEKVVDEKKIIYSVSANGDFFISRKIMVGLILGIGLSIYAGLVFVLQIAVVLLLIMLKKMYDDSKQKLVLSPGRVIFKKTCEVDLKKINKVLVADLKNKTIIEERTLSYHWHVPELMLEDIVEPTKEDGDVMIVKNNILASKGRYSILFNIEEKDLEVLRGLSLEQVRVLLKELAN